ncbi:MAG: FAD-dependent oxidoreductase, partial [Nitrospinota bacterium]
FRLTEEILDEEINNVLDMGATLKTNIWVGKDISVEELAKGCDAVILAAGCLVPVKLNVPNEGADGVMPGLDFMIEVNEGRVDKVSGHVIVIGGGFTAMDCARSAQKLGAQKVSLVYRRTRNELRVDEREIRETSIEGVEFHYLLSPKEIIINGRKHVTEIVFQRNRLTEPGQDGRRGVVPIEGSEIPMKADLVLSAVSQTADHAIAGGKLDVNAGDSSTPIDKVFATGDYVTGPQNIISAIGAAHKTARSVDGFLMGRDRFETKVEKVSWEQKPMGSYTGWKTIKGNIFDLIPRLDNPCVPYEKRKDQNLEVDLGYDKEQTYWQGQRCYLCNHNIEIDEKMCILCYNCVDVCPYNCILMLQEDWVRVYKNGGEPEAENKGHTYMIIDETNCVRCGLCIDACPVPCITMEKTEIETVFNG